MDTLGKHNVKMDLPVTWEETRRAWQVLAGSVDAFVAIPRGTGYLRWEYTPVCLVYMRPRQYVFITRADTRRAAEVPMHVDSGQQARKEWTARTHEITRT